MKVSKIECPFCGASVNFEGDDDICFCTYCGRQIALGERKTIVIKDVAKLRELELQEKEQKYTRKNKEKHNSLRNIATKLIKYSIIALVLLMLASAVIDTFEDTWIIMLIIFLLGVFAVGLVLLLLSLIFNR